MGDRDRSPRRDRRSGGGGGGDGGRKTRKGPAEKRIFVSNLPYEMKWQEVKDLFRQEVGEVAYVELFDDEHGKPRGAGVMEFPTTDMAKTAIEKMHRYDYKGRKIVVKEDFDADRDKHGRIVGRSEGRNDGGSDRRGGGGGGGRHGNMGGGMGMGSGMGGNMGGNMSSGGDMGNTFGLSPQFLSSLNIQGPLHTRVFVANMDYSVDERKLKEVFRLAGRVVGVELQRDKEGKSRGFAVVVFDHPVEAVQAISMLNNQQLFDRKLSVRFDKVEPEAPRRSDRLPDGLHSVGMVLGEGGAPLHDVRENLPSAQEMSNIGNNMSNNSANNMGNNMVAQSNAANVGTAALQAALATIMGIGGMGGAAAGGLGGAMAGNMGGGMGMNSGNGSMGMNSGNSGMGMDMNRSMDRGMGGSMDRGMGGNNDHQRSPMGGSMDRSMGMERGMDRGMNDMGMGGSNSGGMGGTSNSSYGVSSPVGGSQGGWVGASSQAGSNSLQARSDKVVVRGLPESCSWHTLKDRFSHSGDIKFAEMKDRGVGVIRFGTERDAERAVSMMNNQRIDGRVINVGLYL